jgi:hypothetical protein
VALRVGLRGFGIFCDAVWLGSGVDGLGAGYISSGLAVVLAKHKMAIVTLA